MTLNMSSVTVTGPDIQAGQTLSSSSADYSVLEFIGEGCFGKVAKCQNLVTNETVAVKILRTDTQLLQDTKKELAMLEVLSVLDPDHTNVVKFFEHFIHLGQTCLAFEMLDRSVYDHFEERDWKPLSLNEIRPITQQLLVALDALKGLSILHTDIKPDNIMFVNKPDQPLKVKLIDFGEAILTSQVELGMEIQPIGYRAPEVSLGLPFTVAVDVWGLGCVLAFLYLAENLFPVYCDYQMMKCMVEVLGQPEDHQLRAGEYTKFYFCEEDAADGPTWRLMTYEEYTVASNINPEKQDSIMNLPGSLDDLVNVYPKAESTEEENRGSFVDLLKQLLHLDGDQRISPHQALQHKFITTSNLTEQPDSTAYLTTPQTVMTACPTEDSENKTASKPDQWFTAGSTDDAPAKDAVSYENSPSTGSSNGVTATNSSDEELTSVTYDEDLAVWSLEGELSSLSSTEYSATQSSEGELPSLCGTEDSTTESSDGAQIKDCNEDAAAPGSWSSDGPKPTDSTAAASASSGRTRKMLKRIRKFFSAFCCCCCATVED